MASCVKAFSRRPTNPARPYTELCTWTAAVFSITCVVNPTLHPRLLLLRAGDMELNPGPTCSCCSKSIRCNTTSIVCSTCQRHLYINYIRLIRSQKDIQGFVCFFCSGVLVHNLLRQPSAVTAHCHDDDYSVTQRIDTDFIPLCVNSVPASHTGSVLAYPAVWPTLLAVPNILYQLPPSQLNL